MTDSTDNARVCAICEGTGSVSTNDKDRDGFPVEAACPGCADLAPDPLADARVAALVSAATDIATVAQQDDWHRATTGRQIILRNLRAALAALSPTGGNADG